MDQLLVRLLRQLDMYEVFSIKLHIYLSIITFTKNNN